MAAVKVETFQTVDDARALVNELRSRVDPYASDTFVRALRGELKAWMGVLQGKLTTIPPPRNSEVAPARAEVSGVALVPALTLDDIDLNWPTEDTWYEVGEQTRLLVRNGDPVEIETMSFNLGEALNAAEESYGKPIELMGAWTMHEDGRARAWVRVVKLPEEGILT